MLFSHNRLKMNISYGVEHNITIPCLLPYDNKLNFHQCLAQILTVFVFAFLFGSVSVFLSELVFVVGFVFAVVFAVVIVLDL